MASRDMSMFGKILVPVDGSEASNQGLIEAVKLATMLGSRVYLVHVVEEFVVDYGFSAPQYATALIDSMREKGREVLAQALSEAKKFGVHPQGALLETVAGPAADLIISHAKNIGANLIVMGTHGRRGLRRLALGSDAEAVVRLAEIPVLLIRGEASHAGSPRVSGTPLSATPAAALELG